MQWGRKKTYNSPFSPSSSSSSRPSLISQVLPSSWLSKFKHMRVTREAKTRKFEQKGKMNSNSNSLSVRSPKYAGGKNGGRFYSGDDDNFWRLSFGEESIDGTQSRTVPRSVWFDSNDGQLQIPTSRCRCCQLKCTKVGDKEETLELMREFPTDMGMNRRVSEMKIKTPRRGLGKDWRLRNMGRTDSEKTSLNRESELKEVDKKARKSVENGISCTSLRNEKKLKNSGKNPNLSLKKSRNCNLGTGGENCLLNFQEFDSEWERMKDLKIEELKSRYEKQRKSLYVSRESHQRRTKSSSKIRIYSPRTASKVEICKIKALEDMKKAKLKMKSKKTKARTENREITGLESFAVAKCSFDPQQDFRDSMMEMIMEKRIVKAEELEELLACYLTLNSDQYHDLIIKEFRQVWFELNRVRCASELENQNSGHELFS